MLVGRAAQLGDLVAIDLLHQGLAGLEVAVERTDRHPGPPRDLLDLDLGLPAEERLARRGQERLAVAPRIRAHRT
ncbi:hypothetical protein GCM10020001_063430 [Nonomuraea salmonea]